MVPSNPAISESNPKTYRASATIIGPTYSTSGENPARFCHSRMIPAYFFPIPGIPWISSGVSYASCSRSSQLAGNLRNHRLSTLPGRWRSSGQIAWRSLCRRLNARTFSFTSGTLHTRCNTSLAMGRWSLR